MLGFVKGAARRCAVGHGRPLTEPALRQKPHQRGTPEKFENTLLAQIGYGDITNQAVLRRTLELKEYTAKIFRAACTRMRITQSMGRVGSALDNAVIESWHSTLEFELRALERFATKAQARTRVAAWIDDYNRDRKHSACGMRSPIDYELALHAGEQHDRTDAA